MQLGWEWLKYYKYGQVLAKDTENEDDVNWAKVRVKFATSDSSVTEAYEARFECCGSVITAENSGGTTAPVKQFRVSRLVKVM